MGDFGSQTEVERSVTITFSFETTRPVSDVYNLSNAVADFFEMFARDIRNPDSTAGKEAAGAVVYDYGQLRVTWESTCRAAPRK